MTSSWALRTGTRRPNAPERMHVFHGSAIGLELTPAGTFTGVAAFDHLGTSVTGGADLRGEGYGSVVGGAPGGNYVMIQYGFAGGISGPGRPSEASPARSPWNERGLPRGHRRQRLRRLDHRRSRGERRARCVHLMYGHPFGLDTSYVASLHPGERDRWRRTRQSGPRAPAIQRRRPCGLPFASRTAVAGRVELYSGPTAWSPASIRRASSGCGREPVSQARG